MIHATVDQAPPPLRIVRLRLDAAGLFGLARHRRLPLRDLDAGYVAHCALDELFGPAVVRPFVVEDATRRTWSILGYAADDAATLTERARAGSDPDTWSLCDWNALVDKAMPAAWRPGTRLAFRLRACPIQRMASESPRHRKGAEVDVFLARCWAAGPDTTLNRSEIYTEWLERQLSANGAAETTALTMEGFRRTRLLRRTQGGERRAATCERPEVHFRGELLVRDGAAFQQLLSRGIGRHRAFGFGMLRLSHASAIR